MKIHICKRCKCIKVCDIHHLYGVENNRSETIDLCRECHRWVHDIGEQAYKEGFLRRMDGVYRKKPTKKSKWVLKKKVGIDNFK